MGRAQSTVLTGSLRSPAHQCSLVTMSDQPRRPARVSAMISMTDLWFRAVALSSGLVRLEKVQVLQYGAGSALTAEKP
jgi:hypothetical protein